MAQLNNLIVNGSSTLNGDVNCSGSLNVGSIANVEQKLKDIQTSVDGKAASSHTHNTILDSYNNTATKIAYSQSGLSTTSWFACWNGYELRAISPASTLSTIKALPLAGGTVTGNLVVNGQLHVTNTADVGLNQAGALIIGNKAASNIGIDDNEIMARNNSAASTLYLNNEGGLVQIGTGGLSVNGQALVKNDTAYTTSKVRNIHFATTTGTPANGAILLVYA